MVHDEPSELPRTDNVCVRVGHDRGTVMLIDVTGSTAPRSTLRVVGHVPSELSQYEA